MATDERRNLTESPAPESRRSTAPAHREDWSAFWSDPFANFWRGMAPSRRFAQEMDRWFQHPGVSRGGEMDATDRSRAWAPEIETFQRGDEFVVRADLPGMRRDDITVHANEGALTIEGERRSEEDERRSGYYRSERSYGRFCRVIPLPDGALTDTARASFKEGVLEVVLHAPPHEVSRGRRIDITDGGTVKTDKPTIYPE
jgi:HSP20 family protein